MMKLAKVFLIFQFLGLSSGLFIVAREPLTFTFNIERHHHDFSMPVPEMIKSQGYPCQIHKYVTKDGYINSLHRIPKSHPKGVIFLQHGLLGTSADYVMGSPHNSIGYYLSDLGYDVWLGNARGNLYSRSHKRLTTDDHAYWQFSWMEMGKYDIPAAVDYIRNATKKNKITYIGHSMGTTMFWAALNENQRLKDKIDLMIAMGPVAKVYHMISPIRLLAPYDKELELLFKLIGVDEFEPSNEMIQTFVEYACDKTMIEAEVCQNILFLLTGYDNLQANQTLLPYILGHEPGGTSVHTVIHFAQLINSGKFRRFDYGSPEDNKKAYGVPAPPDYDLKKVKVPVALLWAKNDWLADPKDVEYLINGLPNIIKNYEIPFPKFNHVDFLWAMDAPKMVFEPIAKILHKH